VLAVLGPGTVFGELAVLNSAPRHATLKASADSVTVVIDKSTIDTVLDRHPAAVREMLGVLARSLTLAKEDIARDNSELEEIVRQRTDELRSTHLEIVPPACAGRRVARRHDRAPHQPRQPASPRRSPWPPGCRPRAAR